MCTSVVVVAVVIVIALVIAVSGIVIIVFTIVTAGRCPCTSTMSVCVHVCEGVSICTMP